MISSPPIRSNDSLLPNEKMTASDCFFPRRGGISISDSPRPLRSKLPLAGPFARRVAPGKDGGRRGHAKATWLVSRELAEAAGPWDTRLQYDQDGEYFSRVLAQSEGTRFVPDAKVFYRASNSNRISYIGNWDTKKDSLFVSLMLHIQYIRALEESERVRKACLAYLRIWYPFFYPDRPDVAEQLQGLATELGGRLEVPQLRRKFSWMSPVFGRKAATWAQRVLPETKASFSRTWDRAMFKLETHAADAGPASNDGEAKEN